MYNVMIFGTSSGFFSIVSPALHTENINLLAFIDNDKKKQGKTISHYPIIPAGKIKDYDFDYIIVASMFDREIVPQLLNAGVSQEKIICIFSPEYMKDNKNIRMIIDMDRINHAIFSMIPPKPIIDDVKLNQILFNQSKVHFYEGEKIRIVFLFQIPSFWSSWESFYEACASDNRFDVKFVLFDKVYNEKSQTKGARHFLDQLGIPYVLYKKFELEDYHPHIIVVQTPMDGHRPCALRGDILKSQGYRIVYIPYGIELVDSQEGTKRHYHNKVVLNAWRIYTFSPMMKSYYFHHLPFGAGSVRTIGHPKFDALFKMQNESMPADIRAMAKGRKIVLWKVHFKRMLAENGGISEYTPYLREYLDFVDHIPKIEDMFFVFMHHPKFFEKSVVFPALSELKSKLLSLKNLYIYDKPDYGPVLSSSDYIIADRSSVTIEAIYTQKPLLFMENKDYQEQFTLPVRKILDSYYYGTGCEDMLNFLDMCRKGEDIQKERRATALKSIIPNLNGTIGRQIKDDILNGLAKEADLRY